jgi:hypothetical protein
MNQPNDNNPFSPPKAQVADIATAPAQGTGTPLFFAVSTRKLAVMFLCTFSLYQYLWLYQNWKLVRQRTGEKLTPALRTFFAVFFCYALFKRIREQGMATTGTQLAAGSLATLWTVLALLGNLPEPWFFMSFFTLVPLLTVQTVVNDINAVAAPGHAPNNTFSPLNWVAIVIGGLFIGLVLIGLLLR